VTLDAGHCRACRARLKVQVLDLGEQPVVDILLLARELDKAEPLFPLRLFVCHRCGLAQLPSGDVDRLDVSAIHGHGAAFSSTVMDHVRRWAESVISEPRSRRRMHGAVLDVSSGSGALLRPFQKYGWRVLGVEANAETAAGAEVPTEQGVFGLDLAHRLVAAHGQFDLILVNHALAHANDVLDYVAGLAWALRPGGTLEIEFIHVLSLVHGQFDVVDHAHRSYLSLHALAAALAEHGLVPVDAERVDLHGGSIRAVARHASDEPTVRSGVLQVLDLERAERLDTPIGFQHLPATAEHVKGGLRSFLDKVHAEGARVVGYGAPNRGTMLLNYCQVTSDDIAFTVDRSPAKQGHVLPGCRLPVLAPEEIFAARPNYVLILPWPLREEIVQQMADISQWGARFVVAVPELRILD